MLSDDERESLKYYHFTNWISLSVDYFYYHKIQYCCIDICKKAHNNRKLHVGSYKIAAVNGRGCRILIVSANLLISPRSVEESGRPFTKRTRRLINENDFLI